MLKYLIPILTIIVGEVLTIYAEVKGAKLFVDDLSIISSFVKMLLPVLIGSCFLLLGYILGIKYLKDIWVVSVVSITAVIISEVVINYFIFGTLPYGKTLIGLIFSVIGLIIVSI